MAFRKESVNEKNASGNERHGVARKLAEQRVAAGRAKRNSYILKIAFNSAALPILATGSLVTKSRYAFLAPR